MTLFLGILGPGSRCHDSLFLIGIRAELPIPQSDFPRAVEDDFQYVAVAVHRPFHRSDV
jgi:hypothetical protein